MRFVDREQRDLCGVEQFEAAIGDEPFGRDVENVDFARAHLALDGLLLGPGERRVQEIRAHTGFAQGGHLVLHQRDERRDDHADTVAHERGDLVAQ